MGENAWGGLQSVMRNTAQSLRGDFPNDVDLANLPAFSVPDEFAVKPAEDEQKERSANTKSLSADAPVFVPASMQNTEVTTEKHPVRKMNQERRPGEDRKHVSHVLRPGVVPDGALPGQHRGEHEVVRVFKPGALGLKANWQADRKVMEVARTGQAAANGIIPGMIVSKVGGEDYSEAKLNEFIAGKYSDSYTITFRVVHSERAISTAPTMPGPRGALAAPPPPSGLVVSEAPTTTKVGVSRGTKIDSRGAT